MPSQKYAMREWMDTGAYYWKCILLLDECAFTSYSNAKPRCESCPYKKRYFKDHPDIKK